MDRTQLQEFIWTCTQRGYASGAIRRQVEEPDRQTTILITEEGWTFYDRWDGGEPYAGCIRVTCEDERTVWRMHYAGRRLATASANLQDGINETVVQALREMPKEAPFRGPQDYVRGPWRYTTSWGGSVDWFSGTETVFHNNIAVYAGMYHGGIVNKDD